MELQLKNLYLEFQVISVWNGLGDNSGKIKFNDSTFTQSELYIGKTFIPNLDIKLNTNNSTLGIKIQFDSVPNNTTLLNLLYDFMQILNLNLLIFLKTTDANCLLPYFKINSNSYKFYGTTNDQNIVDIKSQVLNPGKIEVIQTVTLDKNENIFNLENIPKETSNLARQINEALLNAQHAHDFISEYILLYYILEIIYNTDAFKEIKNEFSKKHKNIGKYRSRILKKYLNDVLEIENIDNFEKSKITEDFLKEIIVTRNSLAHKADESNLNHVIYNNLFPLIQTIAKKINNY